jgi:hypothetical protein
MATVTATRPAALSDEQIQLEVLVELKNRITVSYS